MLLWSFTNSKESSISIHFYYYNAIAHFCSFLLIFAHFCSFLLIFAHFCSFLLIFAHFLISTFLYTPGQSNVEFSLRVWLSQKGTIMQWSSRFLYVSRIRQCPISFLINQKDLHLIIFRLFYLQTLSHEYSYLFFVDILNFPDISHKLLASLTWFMFY